MKSCGTFSMGVFSDNQLYGWGMNECGQMGIKNELGVEMYETA
jgi:hypothetical protein